MTVLRFLNLLAAAAVLLVACLALGGMVDARLDLITHFALPLTFAALASLAFALWAARRRPDAAIIVASLAALVCLVLTGPELAARFAPRSAPASEPQLTLMTFNTFIDNADPAGTAATIRRSGADVVLVVEVYKGNTIPQMTTAAYPHQARCHCGMAILSRWPIVDDSVRRDLRPGNQREPSVMWATIQSPSGEVTVMGTHYRWPTQPTSQASTQATILKEAVRFDPRSLILMGDFNSTPWSFFMRRQDRMFPMERRTRGLATWPSRISPVQGVPVGAPIPLLPIDHVYAGDAWRTVSVRRGPQAGSDHYPVIVTLSLKPHP